jgi:hypothetical protein
MFCFCSLCLLFSSEELELVVTISYGKHEIDVRIINNSDKAKWIVCPDLFLQNYLEIYINGKFQKGTRYAIIDNFSSDFVNDISDSFYKIEPNQCYRYLISYKCQVLDDDLIRVDIFNTGLSYYFLPTDTIELVVKYFIEDNHKDTFITKFPDQRLDEIFIFKSVEISTNS